jgi:hypothetical protein
MNEQKKKRKRKRKRKRKKKKRGRGQVSVACLDFPATAMSDPSILTAGVAVGQARFATGRNAVAKLA